jgi:DNA replication ATP-dependent helicase Dna2
MPAANSKTPVEIYQELRELVMAEARSARDEHERLLYKPVRDRILQGKCLSNVKFLKKLSGGVLRFSCRNNQAEFREGDLVILHEGDPMKPVCQAQWAGDGLGLDGQEYIDLVTSEPSLEKINGSDGVFTVDAGFFDLSPQLLRALEEMGSSERGRAQILPLLGETIEVEGVDPFEYEESAGHASEEGYNPSQEEAVGVGSSCKWCALIQGPPGTGKTRVLAQIVRERLNRGERILVTACTHRAIDEALNKIKAINPECERIAKIGVMGTQLVEGVPLYEKFADSDLDESLEGFVIGATPYCAFSDRLRQVEFDCVLIDEASQMTLPLAVMAMLRADKYVVIGDEKQLPPVILSKSSFEAQNYGLFQRLGRVSERELLNTTYRMNQEICDWISQEFYFGELEADESCRDKKLNLSGQASAAWLSDALSPEHSIVWIPTQMKSTRQYSMEEADLVNQLMSELHRRGHDISDVGIITPFRRQARLIRHRLQQNKDWDPSVLRDVVIDTVERMQGQERSVIILSTAAADAGFLDSIQEFIYLPARLNVIVSRAKVKVIILAANGFLEINPSSDDAASAIGHWRNLQGSSHVVDV